MGLQSQAQLRFSDVTRRESFGKNNNNNPHIGTRSGNQRHSELKEWTFNLYRGYIQHSCITYSCYIALDVLCAIISFLHKERERGDLEEFEERHQYSCRGRTPPSMTRSCFGLNQGQKVMT